MTPGPSDEVNGKRGCTSEPRTSGIKCAVAERLRCLTVVTGQDDLRVGVRIPAVGIVFAICCVCLIAAPLADTGTVSRAALSAAARPAAELELGLWTTATRRLRVPRISLRRFRTRLAYSYNTCATRQTGRYSYRPAVVMAGDVELNPGPDSTASVLPPGTLSPHGVPC